MSYKVGAGIIIFIIILLLIFIGFRELSILAIELSEIYVDFILLQRP